MNEQEVKELIQDAKKHGAAASEIALCEFILKSYGHTLHPQLKALLEKVAEKNYEVMSKFTQKPTEDLALQVNNYVEKVVTVTE